VNWSRPTDSGSTENAGLENRKLFKILFKLLYLRFPPLQIRTCVFRTCVFHPCIFVLTYSVLAYSILRYCRFPYLRFQSPRMRTRYTRWSGIGLQSAFRRVTHQRPCRRRRRRVYFGPYRNNPDNNGMDQNRYNTRSTTIVYRTDRQALYTARFCRTGKLATADTWVRTCRTSSFCIVAWQLARFQLTRRSARSLGDSWASCFI